MVPTNLVPPASPDWATNNRQTEKLVGVLGGMGPLATAYFLERIVARTAANKDQDQVNLIVFSHAAIPDRTDFIGGRNVANPAPILINDAQRLANFGADFLVMPCNTAHFFAPDIQAAIEIPLLSIVEVTVAAALAQAPGCAVVGLLATEGTIAAKVYSDAFAAHGVAVITPASDDQKLVNSLIYDQVKAGLPANLPTLQTVTNRLVDRGAEIVILGCTELSVAALDYNLLASPIYCDSMEQLVQATILAAGHEVV